MIIKSSANRQENTSSRDTKQLTNQNQSFCEENLGVQKKSRSLEISFLISSN